MKNLTFPDPLVSEYIDAFSKRFDFFVESLEVNPREDVDGRTIESWKWILKKMGSPIEIVIFMGMPSYIPTVWFIHAERKKSGVFPSDFSFFEYLKKYLHANSDLMKIDKVVAEQSWKDNWHVELDLLQDHLKNGKLREVVEGIFWPEIYFDWTDYVEPEVADRVYEDQIKVIEEHDKNRGNRAWIYFLSFFKRDK